MDFMNLNQAAHGDREFGYIQTRLGVARKTVTGHVSDPAVAGEVGAWARAAAAGWARRARCELARFGDNMRDVAVTEGDKVEAELRFGVSVNTYGVNDLVESVDAVPDAGIDSLVAQYEDLYDVAPELRSGGERHESLRYGARIELGLRSFLAAGGFTAFTTNFEDLGGLRQLPGLAVQRLMADGYGFGAEGDWKTAVLVRAAKVMGAGLPGGASLHGGLHLPPRARASRRSSARTCSRSARRSRPPPEPRDPPARHRRPRGPGAAGLRRRPGPGVVVGDVATCGDRFRLVANDVEVVAPDEPLPNLPVARAVWKPAPTWRRRPRRG